MGAQPLSRRSLRRAIRHTGIAVMLGHGHGSYEHELITYRHGHFAWDTRTGNHWLLDDPVHTTRCLALWPDAGNHSPDMSRADLAWMLHPRETNAELVQAGWPVVLVTDWITDDALALYLR